MASRHPSASIRVLFVCDTAATDVFFPLVSRRRKKNSAGFVFFGRFGALNKVKKNAAAAAALDISNPFFFLTRHQHRRRVRRLSLSPPAFLAVAPSVDMRNHPKREIM